MGRNGSLLLNFPIDKRGLIHENDIRQLQAMAKQIKVDFAHNLARESKASTSSYRGKGYEAKRVLDGDKKTYWATADNVIQASLTIEFNQSTTFNRFLVQEYIQLGQRVKSFIVETRNDGAWREISRETTIGYKRILRFADVTATAVRLKILDSKACPTISNVEIFYAP